VRSALLVLLSLSLLCPGAVSAQSFEQIGFLRLNDTTPRSTRSLSIGGAADPLGDEDIVANPATIASAARPRFIVQGARNSVAVTRYDVAGNLVTTNRAWVNSGGLSQIAALIPLQRGLVVGAYYASEPRLRGLDPLVGSFGTTAYTAPACADVCAYAVPVVNAAFERRDRRSGVAVGWERGAISIGAGADLRQIDERIETGRAVLSQGLSSTTQNDRLFRRIDDHSIVPNAGIRWRVTSRVALAAAYNGGGSFHRTTSACNVSGFDFGTCLSALEQIGTSTVRMPDTLRAGVALAATDRLRLIGEAVRHNYSTLALDRYTVFGGEQRFPYRDVTELHAGAEYRLASLPVVLRAGWWRDPTRYLQQFVAAHETVHHYTVGAGITFGAARVDLAYDDADSPMQRRALVGVEFGL
jgi:hypothetical protein